MIGTSVQVMLTRTAASSRFDWGKTIERQKAHHRAPAAAEMGQIDRRRRRRGCAQTSAEYSLDKTFFIDGAVVPVFVGPPKNQSGVERAHRTPKLLNRLHLSPRDLMSKHDFCVEEFASRR